MRFIEGRKEEIKNIKYFNLLDEYLIEDIIYKEFNLLDIFKDTQFILYKNEELNKKYLLQNLEFNLLYKKLSSKCVFLNANEDEFNNNFNIYLDINDIIEDETNELFTKNEVSKIFNNVLYNKFYKLYAEITHLNAVSTHYIKNFIIDELDEREKIVFSSYFNLEYGDYLYFLYYYFLFYKMKFIYKISKIEMDYIINLFEFSNEELNIWILNETITDYIFNKFEE